METYTDNKKKGGACKRLAVQTISFFFFYSSIRLLIYPKGTFEVEVQLTGMESGESPEAEEREAHPHEATEYQQEVRR